MNYSEYQTLSAKVERWVEGISAIDTNILLALLESGKGNIEEITPDEYDEAGNPIEEEKDSFFPNNDMLFTFRFSPMFFEDWLVDHLDKMKEFGFRVYETDFGFFFGFDSCSDVIGKHFMPLYRAIGIDRYREFEPLRIDVGEDKETEVDDDLDP